ncbi:MAG: FAD-dependent oxidoreductase [Bacteroidota bacterium]
MKSLLFTLFLLVSISLFSQTKIAIIGGGIAGIASAYYLHEFDPEAQITIFEKESQLGGNAQTITVKNSQNEDVMIDIGPQFFTKGPWNDYIQFIEEAIGFENLKTEKVYTSLVMEKRAEKKRLLITPLKTKLRREKLSNLLKLRKFNMAAYKVYRSPEKWIGKTTEEWVNELDFENEYKTEIILPFLAASLGTSITQVKSIAICELVNFFAFRKPKISNSFEIISSGMGVLLQGIGLKLVNSGVQIKNSSPVHSVAHDSSGYRLVYGQGEDIQDEPEVYDFLVMAIHPEAATKLLSNDNEFDKMSMLLKDLPYFQVDIALHRDKQFIHEQDPSFLNIQTTFDNEVESHSMNLGMISDQYSGIYKSWVNNRQIEEIKANGKLFATATFWINLVTPQVVLNLNQLKVEVGTFNSLAIIGGWSEGMETQNTAVKSALRSLESYKAFKK